ncbi:MAG: NAD(P)-dependent glycerol-3-phosphate dehydrogenase [Elusimicrobia bacterium]|nr:NAD(P)-dependent glycerol-3-phosphate dehydrogenase [Elusimicrobiota bacterium]
MNIAVIGAGAWGATLAQYLKKKGHNIFLWEFNKPRINYLQRHKHPLFFPHIKLSKNIFLTNNFSLVIPKAKIILLTVPAQTLRSTLKKLSKYTNKKQIFVIASKGIEINSGKRLSEVVREELNTKNITVLSGPSFAKEVAHELPTTLTVAGNIKNSKTIQNNFSSRNLRIYTNPDIIGVELGGALKNIIAVACGIAKGMGLGDNTSAAIITRGLVEITRFGKKLGAKKETFSGLSGMGDMVMTSFSRNSRNETFGELIGRGFKTGEAIKKIGMTVEGVPTTKAVVKLSKKIKIEMPITNEVYKIIFKNVSPKRAISTLMTRSAKPE